MYAIVEVGGAQFKVTKSAVVSVPKMNIEPGKSVDLDRVLLIVDDKSVNIGNPVVKNAVVKATVVDHGKDGKVLVFKKKRRKTYRVLRGHRQQYTQLKIENISMGKAADKPAEKKEEPKAAAPRPGAEAKPKAAETKAVPVKKTASPEKKKAAAKKAAAPKTEAKKAPAKPSKKKEA
ncbi:50S ribosomal protein L21 [bacterium]|nr:50S ribosomal protein L21 [bacterium]